jgi:putative transposase
MARTKRSVERLETIWTCPDDLWHLLIEPVLRALDPPPRRGRPRIDQRRALDGVIYHLRTGCQWNALPRQFGDDSSVHRTFTRWKLRGVVDEVLALILAAGVDLGLVDWTWQCADGFLGKARKGATEWVRTLRIVGKTAANARCWSKAAAGR